MKISAFMYRLLNATIGNLFPDIVFPLGKIGNVLRCSIAKIIVKRMGKHCIVARGSIIKEGVILEDYASIGVKNLISRGTIIHGHNMMGPNVKVFTQNHIYNPDNHCFSGYTEIKPVEIGENSWIGYNCIILPGVKIGKNSIVGAGSVVTKDVPDGTMVAGNPAIVKKVIDKEIYFEYIRNNKE